VNRREIDPDILDILNQTLYPGSGEKPRKKIKLSYLELPISDGRRAKNFKLRLEWSRDHCLGLFNNGVCLG